MMSQEQFDTLTIADLLDQKWLPDDVASIEVIGLCLDHRQLQAGEVFIAVPGAQHDGRQFIDEAVAKGAAAVLAQADSEEETISWCGSSWRGQAPVIPQVNLSQLLSHIAGNFYSHPSRRANVIGITGTNGKSTCSHLLAQLLHRLGQPSAVVGTLGYGAVSENHILEDLQSTGLTTADAVATQKILAELVDKGAKYIGMEVSSHALVQHRVDDIKFSVALFTNLSRDHLDYHGDMRSYAQAKQLLLDQPGLKHRILNWDDEFGRYLSAKTQAGVQSWTYSFNDPAAHIYAKTVTRSNQGIEAELESVWGKGRLTTQLMGSFNFSNLLGVVVSACVLGYELDEVLSCCQYLLPVAGRMEKVGDSGELSVVVDFAHTPDALANALKAVREHTSGKLICLFGCGGDRDKGKRPLMAQIAEQLSDVVIVTSDNPRSEIPSDIISDIHAGFKDVSKVVEIEDRAEAIKFCINSANSGDSVLIAGKGHEDYQQIGNDRLPFSDVKQARLALRNRKAST